MRAREVESQECAGCGGVAVCCVWCRVGKHDRATAPTPGGSTAWTRKARVGPQRRGPLQDVTAAKKLGPLSWEMTLTCKHTVTGTREQERARCPNCRCEETQYPNGPPRRVVTHGPEEDLLECGHRVPVGRTVRGRKPDYTRGRIPKRNCRQCLAATKAAA